MTEMSAFRAIFFGAMVVASTPALSQAPLLTLGLVRIDPNDPNVFSARQRIVAANVVKRQ
jgi:hypothetical protein